MLKNYPVSAGLYLQPSFPRRCEAPMIHRVHHGAGSSLRSREKLWKWSARSRWRPKDQGSPARFHLPKCEVFSTNPSFDLRETLVFVHGVSFEFFLAPTHHHRTKHHRNARWKLEGLDLSLSCGE